MTIPYTPEQIVTVLETQDITVISPPTHGETVSGAYTVELTGITTPPPDASRASRVVSIALAMLRNPIAWMQQALFR